MFSDMTFNVKFYILSQIFYKKLGEYKEYNHRRFLVPDITQTILLEIWHHFWLKNDGEK